MLPALTRPTGADGEDGELTTLRNELLRTIALEFPAIRKRLILLCAEWKGDTTAFSKMVRSELKDSPSMSRGFIISRLADLARVHSGCVPDDPKSWLLPGHGFEPVTAFVPAFEFRVQRRWRPEHGTQWGSFEAYLDAEYARRKEQYRASVYALAESHGWRRPGSMSIERLDRALSRFVRRKIGGVRASTLAREANHRSTRGVEREIARIAALVRWDDERAGSGSVAATSVALVPRRSESGRVSGRRFDALRAILQVPSDASSKVLAKAWQRARRDRHPDAGGDKDAYSAFTREYEPLYKMLIARTQKREAGRGVRRAYAPQWSKWESGIAALAETEIPGGRPAQAIGPKAAKGASDGTCAQCQKPHNNVKFCSRRCAKDWQKARPETTERPTVKCPQCRNPHHNLRFCSRLCAQGWRKAHPLEKFFRRP